MSGNVGTVAQREWITRVLGIELPVNDDAALRRSLLDRIRAMAGTARALPADRVPAFIAQATAAKALVDGADLDAARIAVEQLEVFDEPVATPAPDPAPIIARRRALLADVAALTDAAFADAEGAAALSGARAGANAALSPELPTPEQFATAEAAIAAFGTAREAITGRVAAQRQQKLAQATALAVPGFAAAAAAAALTLSRDAAVAALAPDLPTPQQFADAGQAIAAFAIALAAEQQRVAAQRQQKLAEATSLTVPGFADVAAAAALALSRDTALAVLAADQPTPQQFADADEAIAAYAIALAAEQQRVAAQRLQKLAEATALAVPGFADVAAAASLTLLRDAATAALAADLPTPQQFADAEQAITAFGIALAAEQRRVAAQRQQMLTTMGTLVDPPHADTGALAALKIARDRASLALAGETPAPPQIAEAAAAIADFAIGLAAETARVTEQRRALLVTVGTLLAPPFADIAATATLKTERDAATLALTEALPTPAQFTEAARAIAAFATALAAAISRITDKCHELRARLAPLGDPPGADADETQAMKAARDAATLALTAETPLPDELAAAEKAIALLARLVKQISKTAGLAAAGRPQAAAAARGALKAFRAVNGDVEVTPEMVAGAAQATATAAAKVAAATTAWNTSQSLPEGSADEIEQKKLAAEAALNDFTLAQQEHNAAATAEEALFGHKALTDALAHGPLSAESGRPFDDATAGLLIAGFQADPRLTATAVEAAATAKYPEMIAQGLDTVIGKIQGGFEASDTTSWTDPEFARGYGGNLLKMAGNVGPGYYDYLDDYLASGGQFKTNPLGNEGGMSWERMAQQRSVAVAAGLVQPDGSIDLTTDAAKATIGHALYNTTSLTVAAPALTAHILKTVSFLQDGTTGPEANAVLQGMGVPEPAKGGATLVRRALGASRPGGKADTDPIDETDARIAVMAAMLKPLDQGSVGSCFSTAPARRVREQQPIEAMKAFAQIAGDGTYQPAGGEKVAVVTNLPADEDPIMRGWEYSLATAAVRAGATHQKSLLGANLDLGIDQLKGVAVPTGPNQDKLWATRKKKLKAFIENAFTLAYDPTAIATDANDGSSSAGRFIVQRKGGGAEIRTKDDFIDQMTDVAVKSLGLKTAEEATKIRDLVKSDAFINAVCPDKYKPWEMPTGGQSPDVARALHGPGIAYSALLGAAPKTTPPQAEGARTREVLESFLDGLGSGTEEMVTVDTAGMHSFNALPNHPSLQALKGATPTETAQKVQANLIDKGQALKNTDLTAEHAAWMFDQEVAKALDGQSDPALKTLIEDGARAHRPAAPIKPPALAIAITEAMAAFHQKVAETMAAGWKSTEEGAGKTIDGPALDQKKADLKKGFDDHAELSVKGTMMRDLAVPEFVIADTNWGGCQNHVFFVIAPDPITGDPVLWKKTEPPGTLEHMAREWVDTQWATIK